jgi:hypothetical protein
MNSITVIYSNAGDIDCHCLSRIWEGIDNVRVIEITPSSRDWEDEVDSAIAAEEDTIIFAGHGSSYGLLFPDLYSGEYLLHENNVGLIRARNVICIFCYASSFCERVGLHAFATSMFISNDREAVDNGIYGYDQDSINSVGIRFHSEVNSLLRESVSIDEWVMRLGAHMDTDNAVDVFNRQCLWHD